MLYKNPKGTVERLDRAIKEFDKTDNFVVCEQIGIFQHERLIHLIVTVFVGILAIILLIGVLSIGNIYLFALSLLLIILEGAYLWHYYLLENKLQELEMLYLERIQNENGEHRKEEVN